MVYQLVERLHGLGSSAEFSLDEWRMGVRHLRVPAVHRREGSLLEWLERAEPPKTYDEADCQVFIHAITPEIGLLESGGYQSPSQRGVIFLVVELPIRQSATATPDTLQMVRESLTMPCQTISAAGRHMGAVQWARNLPQAKEETSSMSSRTMAPLDEEAIQIEQVAYQRVCNSRIQECSKSTVPDQGIVFDEHNHPWDIRPGQALRREEPAPTSGRSRDERVVPPVGRQQPKGNTGGPPGELPGGGGRGDNDGGPSFPGEEEDDGSQVPSDEEEIMEMPVLGGTVTKGRGPRNIPQAKNYFMPYQWPYTAELDIYKDRGNPWPSIRNIVL